ncbi:MAG: cold shock domain-containing protein [Elusimicrobiota bacterium]|nr:cold shock domain-containing protein [Elusimicrobiota bacterium]
MKAQILTGTLDSHGSTEFYRKAVIFFQAAEQFLIDKVAKVLRLKSRRQETELAVKADSVRSVPYVAVGKVDKLFDRGFGFLTSSSDLKSYFFHLSGLQGGLRWENVKLNMPVSFVVANESTAFKAGKAIQIRPYSGH